MASKRSRSPRPGGDLFTEQEQRARARSAPLAERVRPATLEEFVGQAHLVGAGRLLRDLIEGGKLHSIILWGPPGSGKTTLASLIARSTQAHFAHFSAVLSGVGELREIIAEAREQLALHGRRTVLFVDEIHRFNKAQQDAFLPHVEDGTVVLVGATTENPSFEVISPLLSRASVLVLEPLTAADVKEIVARALADEERGLGRHRLAIAEDALDFLAQNARGDARVALNVLEVAAEIALRHGGEIALATAEEAAQHRALLYDKAGEEHYNVISAFIKSMRDSDPDGAVYWLMRMLEAGEDPLFVARRMVIFAAEDVGNADPRALQVAVAAKDAFHFVGLPEGRIPLSQAAIYLATAPKSNASYKAMLAAAADVKEHGPLPVPLHLRNAPTALMKGLGYGRGYKYAHDDPAAADQQHLPDRLAGRRYYHPRDDGEEPIVAESKRKEGGSELESRSDGRKATTDERR